MAAPDRPTQNRAAAPPSDLDLEAAVLGACLMWPEAIGQVRTAVAIDDFYRPAHRDLYEALLAIGADGAHPDPTSAAARMGDSAPGALDGLGGHSGLMDLVIAAPVPSSAVSAAKQIAELAHRRRLLTASSELRSGLFEGVPAAVAEAQLLERLEGHTGAGMRQWSIEEILDEGPPSWCAPGIWPEDSVTILAGRGGCGKSFLAVNLAAHIAAGETVAGLDTFGTAAQRCVIYCAGEGAHGTARRFVAADRGANHNITVIRDGFDLVANTHRVQAAITELEDRSGLAACVVVDTLAKHAGPDHDENDNSHAHRLINALHRLNRPVLLIHHVTKDGGGVRGAGGLTDDGSAAWEMRGPPERARLRPVKVRDWEATSLDVLMVDAGDTLRLDTIRPGQSSEPANTYSTKALLDAIVEDPGRSKRHYAPDGGGRASKAFKTLLDNALITVEKTGQGDLCFPAD